MIILEGVIMLEEVLMIYIIKEKPLIRNAVAVVVEVLFALMIDFVE